MQTLFALTVITLMMLGVITLGEMIVRGFKPRQPDSVEPMEYSGVIDAVANGASGIGEHAGQTEHFLGQVGGHLVSAIAHLFHH
ncbi:MAG: hypothetical protein KME13_10725 [Myxacorys californica WJT36-NPBG1]|jgi:Co/Zn/Cd efflux system component|nr:hypothetical protein [Myxacorys californica WJT36-NPBG1]